MKTWTRPLEAIAGFGLIAVYIWYIRAIWPLAALPLLGVIVLSDAFGDNNLDVIGISWARFRQNLKRYSRPLAVMVLIVSVFAVRSPSPVRLLGILALYCLWGVIQQYLLNGFLVNRLRAARIPGVPVLAGLVFGLLHFPNPFLMGVTFAGGIVAALVYQRYRDLLLLGVAHGIIGTLLLVSMPDSLTHRFYVGPNCISFCHEAGHRHDLVQSFTE